MSFLQKVSKARKLPKFFLNIMETLECTSSYAIAAITDARISEFGEKFEQEVKDIASKSDHPDNAEVKAHIRKTTKSDLAENYKISYGILMIIKGNFL